MENIPIMKPYFDEQEIEEVRAVLKTGWVAQGPKVAEFEKLVAEHEGVAHAIATTSCTTALHLVMASMGLRKGQDLLVPSYTFVATANAAAYTGATPVLVEVDTKTFNIDPAWTEKYIEENYEKGEGKKLLNKKTGNELFGIVAVNLFGLCANIPAINEIAKRYNLKVIEDSACALGAGIDGKHEGTFGNPACLSFHPRKSITTGEGGMLLTDDDKLAETARKLRSHAASLSETARHAAKGYLLPDFDDLGFNYRMNDIQAAIGVAQMAKFDKMLDAKVEKAKYYDGLLKNSKYVRSPYVPEGYSHTYQSYVCMIDNDKMGLSVDEAYKIRIKAMDTLENKGVSTRQGTHAVHTLGYYKNNFGYKEEDLPGAYKCDRLSIAIPLYYEMSCEKQEEVVKLLETALEEALSEYNKELKK